MIHSRCISCYDIGILEHRKLKIPEEKTLAIICEGCKGRRIKRYTVIALYRDNLQRSAFHVSTKNPVEAEKAAQTEARHLNKMEEKEPLIVAGVYPGWLIAVDRDKIFEG